MQIILVEPENAGNVGAVARVMKNFGKQKLVLVNPKCDYLSDEAIARAMHGKDILKKCKVIGKIPELNYLVGTTGKLGGKFNVNRVCISPKELKTRKGMGLVFGRESYGLKNDELEKMDIIISIPTNKDYSILNLSHAVAIILYELSDYKLSHDVMGDEIKGIIHLTQELTDDKKIVRVMKQVINRGVVEKQEAYTIAGFLRDLKNRLKK